MKKILLSLFVVGMVASVSIAVAGDDTAWFDLENCAMCKPMMAQEGLMEHMAWDTEIISNGMVSLVTVDPAYADKFAAAHAGMEATTKKLQAGEQMHLCGYCQSTGKLMMAGAKMEPVAFKTGGHMMMLTSSDEAVVKQIKAHAQKTIDEYAKMMAAGE